MKEIYFIREDAVCSEFNVPVSHSEEKKIETKSEPVEVESHYPLYY